MILTYNVNPGVRGISAVMKILQHQVDHIDCEPFSQVSLIVKIPDDQLITLIELLDGLALFYSEVKNASA
jgi:hypothetical protein